MRELAGKVAFITGAGGGIGGALARALHVLGMKVAVADRQLAAAEVTASSIPSDDIISVELDVRDSEGWERARAATEARLGPVSLLVNNAGVGGSGAVAVEDPRRWRAVLEVNAFGAFLGTRTFLPAMLETGEPGHLLFVASLAGLHPTPTLSAYTASKYAVVGLAECLRGELAETAIGVSVAYPGGVQTGFAANSAANLANDGVHVKNGTDTSQILRNGMLPDELASLLVAGVRNGDFHIFSHGGWRSRLEAHFADRLAAYGDESRFRSADDGAVLERAVSGGLEGVQK